MVIYPSAAAHKTTPDITEGATVRKDQVLLLMPDLDKMQVKVGIHEWLDAAVICQSLLHSTVHAAPAASMDLMMNLANACPKASG